MIELRQSWPLPDHPLPIVIFEAGSIVTDGNSLLAIACDTEADWNNITYSEYCTDGLLAWSGGRVLQSRMIRSGKWKYNYYHGCPSQLFNLENDLDEMNNLNRYPKHIEIKSKLEALVLLGWDPDLINDQIQSRDKEKGFFKAWAQSVKPADSFRWETKLEDNWFSNQ